MGQFSVGEVVIATFPFSNLRGHKLRPALVIAQAEFGNVILCQITSKAYSSHSAIKLETKDYAAIPLPVTSYVRPDKLFTADPTIIEKTVVQLRTSATRKILTRVGKLFSHR